MGQAVSSIIRWIFSWGESSDHHDHDHQQQQQHNPNETLKAPLLRAPSSSSSSSYSFFVDSSTTSCINLDSIEYCKALDDTNLVLDLHADHSSSIVIVRSSSLDSSTSSSQCDWEEEFVYPQSINGSVVGEYWIDINEDESMINPVTKIKWINHYSSDQGILLVGEGDFSFSASLGKAFGSATNILATSLNSMEYLQKNYINAMSNIQSLKDRGCIVLHGVDATQMANCLFLKGLKFDRIIFNFPHAGFFPNEPRQSQLRRHRALVDGFLKNAKEMISENGEIHITHKSNGFFIEWKLEALALARGLGLLQELHFNYKDYPGYRTKYGFGGDKNFNCNPSKTYKFGF